MPEFSRCKSKTGEYHWDVRFDMSATALNDETIGVFETMLPQDMAEVVENQGRFPIHNRQRHRIGANLDPNAGW